MTYGNENIHSAMTSFDWFLVLCIFFKSVAFEKFYNFITMLICRHIHGKVQSIDDILSAKLILNSVVTILPFLVSIDFDSIFEKSRSQF